MTKIDPYKLVHVVLDEWNRINVEHSKLTDPKLILEKGHDYSVRTQLLSFIANKMIDYIDEQNKKGGE